MTNKDNDPWDVGNNAPTYRPPEQYEDHNIWSDDDDRVWSVGLVLIVAALLGLVIWCALLTYVVRLYL